MKKLLLINPVGRKSGYMLSTFTRMPPLGLAYVAAATPDNWDVNIIDENFDQFQFEEADLVGITAFTSNINRAFEIARVYRDKGIKVVLGGIHASMAPEEAMQYVDAVVVGEAEGIWQKVLDDFDHNRLLRKYIGPKIDLSTFSIKPRRDLVHPGYRWEAIQTSRGCPFNCNFCSVSRYMGTEYRRRKPEDVLSELSEVKGDLVAFLDDNLIGYTEQHKRVATDLFTGMIKGGLKKKWWMQTSINAADDEKVISLAAEAGCMFAFIGFEAIDEATLKGMKKGINVKIGVERYRQVVGVFHKYGIAVMGAFIIGNNYESTQYHKALSEFMMHSGIDVFQISILTPLPGTALMEQLAKEDRLIYRNFPQDWDKYRLSHIVYQPRETSAELIYAGDNYIKSRLYSFPAYQIRLLKSFYRLKGFHRRYAMYKLNQALKKGWQKAHYFDSKPKLA